MVTRSDLRDSHQRHPIPRPISAAFLSAALILCLISPSAAGAAGKTSPSVETRATELYKAGDYAAVITLFQGLPAETTASKSSVDYQSFLKLLIAQMKNQDPTSPMESTEYVAQIASFSQVEQSVQINQKLDQMLQASSLSQAAALIGRTVTSEDGNTSGVVKEVKLASAGLVAVTQSGSEISITPGVKIS